MTPISARFSTAMLGTEDVGKVADGRSAVKSWGKCGKQAAKDDDKKLSA